MNDDLARITGYVRRTITRARRHAQVGPFLATATPGVPTPYLSYAVPDDGAAPTAADVGALVAWYRADDRPARLEFVPSLAPAVWPALSAAGFERELAAPVLTCVPGALRLPPVPGGVTVASPGTDERRAALAGVRGQAFGDGPDEPVDVAALRSAEERGSVVLGAWAPDGTPLGGGETTPLDGGVVEVAGLGVHPDHQGLGLGAALTAALVADAFARGAVLAFLTAGSDGARSVYRRVGFTTVGEQWHAILATPASP